MRIVTPFTALALAGLLVGATLFAQDKGMPAEPKPGPQHALLKQRVGTWDGAVKLHMGGRTVESKDSMTYRMLGDFWLVGDYDGHLMGQPFQGHEMNTYDPASGQFVSYWAESMSPEMSVSRGTWDEASRTLTFKTAENDPMTGTKGVKTLKVVDGDTFEFSYAHEGDPAPMMEITYTRRK